MGKLTSASSNSEAHFLEESVFFWGRPTARLFSRSAYEKTSYALHLVYPFSTLTIPSKHRRTFSLIIVSSTSFTPQTHTPLSVPCIYYPIYSLSTQQTTKVTYLYIHNPRPFFLPPYHRLSHTLKQIDEGPNATQLPTSLTLVQQIFLHPPLSSNIPP